MYCTHCGKRINEDKIEAKDASVKVTENCNADTKVAYVCPRCGHVIHADLNYEERKELTRATHAEMQRGNNSFSTGMSFLLVGIIIMIISIIFYRLSMKASNGYELSTNCMEFYTFIVTVVIASAGIVAGIVFITLGITKKIHYKQLLQSIQNETFYQ